jgi:tetratricopeptide (TPR) repeat protein
MPMTAKSTRTIRVITVLAGIAIPFTFPLRADEAPYVALERGAQLILAGKYDQAEDALRSGLKRLDGALDNRFYTATANLGATFYYRGRFAEAQSTFRRALQVWSRLPVVSRPDASVVLNNLTLVYLRTGQFDAAEQAAIDVLASRERTNGRNSSSVASALINLGSDLPGTGKVRKGRSGSPQCGSDFLGG